MKESELERKVLKFNLLTNLFSRLVPRFSITSPHAHTSITVQQQRSLQRMGDRTPGQSHVRSIIYTICMLISTISSLKRRSHTDCQDGKEVQSDILEQT
jgi:hypothetical protein